MELNRSELRKELRKRRQALCDAQQNTARVGLFNTVKKLRVLSDSQSIALYLANDGEINPVQILHNLWQLDKKCYLPVISRENKDEMLFAEYHPNTQLVKNRFGIFQPSPEPSEIKAPEQLDLVFLPLTGFDLFGGRLGMGGGFYDRAFAFRPMGKRPLLIGLAHECQKVEKIPTQAWDVPLAGVATDKNYYSFGLADQ